MPSVTTKPKRIDYLALYRRLPDGTEARTLVRWSGERSITAAKKFVRDYVALLGKRGHLRYAPHRGAAHFGGKAILFRIRRPDKVASNKPKGARQAALHSHGRR